MEGANRTLVRAYMGHDRLDTVAQVHLLNVLYNRLWLYDNVFQPVQRLVSKEMVMNTRGERRVRRIFDEASTPLDRLLRAQVLPVEQIDRLLRWRDAIHLMQLQEHICAGIEHLFALPLAHGQRQDVRESLLVPEGEDFLLRGEVRDGEIPWWESPLPTTTGCGQCGQRVALSKLVGKGMALSTSVTVHTPYDNVFR